ncbi:MAG: YciI family protein [Lysobacterales bacterium]
MWYVIRGHEAPDALPIRRAARGAHLARLEDLRNSGRLFVAGPLPAIDSVDPGPAGFVGSLVIAEFATLVDARTWAAADPYLAQGAWSSADVDPFLPVLP